MDSILEHFDQAMLALRLGRQSQTDHERLAQATLARDRFTAVLIELDALCKTDQTMTQDDAWQLWHQEMQKNLAMVEDDFLRIQL